MPINDPTVTIAGQLVADPILRTNKDGQKVTNIRIACTPGQFNKETGWEEKEPIFVNATAWSRTAENISVSLAKGNRVLITGTIKATSWNKNGKKRTGWEIEISEIGASLAFSSVTVTPPVRGAESSDESIDKFLPPKNQWNSGTTDETEPF